MLTLIIRFKLYEKNNLSKNLYPKPPYPVKCPLFCVCQPVCVSSSFVFFLIFGFSAMHQFIASTNQKKKNLHTLKKINLFCMQK